MTISIIGTGFVGVVSAAVFASFGHTVYGIDIDEKKIRMLQKAQPPFYEPNLAELLRETQQSNQLHFTTDYSVAIPQSEICIIAVGTPSGKDGSVDLTYVDAALTSLAEYLVPNQIIAIKSTVPPHAVDHVKSKLSELTKTPCYVATIPEFLREGSAVYDTLHPSRIVIGADQPEVFAKLEQLHKPLAAPVIKINPASAQMSKYAANAYLATRIMFANQLADLCETNGADVQEVLTAIGYDPRIGSHYWYPGLGYGGSCFPKDVRELAHYSRSVGAKHNLFNKIQDLNEERLSQLLASYSKWVGGWDGKTVAVLGLAFKPNTDDVREAPSTHIVPELLRQGARVYGYDPEASLLKFNIVPTEHFQQYREFESLAAAVQDADILLALIEWPIITSFDFGSVRKAGSKQWFIDARNQFDPKQVQDWGFLYRGVGRGRIDQ